MSISPRQCANHPICQSETSDSSGYCHDCIKKVACMQCGKPDGEWRHIPYARSPETIHRIVSGGYCNLCRIHSTREENTKQWHYSVLKGTCKCCKQTLLWGKHHCRECGHEVCDTCSQDRVPIYAYSNRGSCVPSERICDQCSTRRTSFISLIFETNSLDYFQQKRSYDYITNDPRGKLIPLAIKSSSQLFLNDIKSASKTYKHWEKATSQKEFDKTKSKWNNYKKVYEFYSEKINSTYEDQILIQAHNIKHGIKTRLENNPLNQVRIIPAPDNDSAPPPTHHSENSAPSTARQSYNNSAPPTTRHSENSDPSTARQSYNNSVSPTTRHLENTGPSTARHSHNNITPRQSHVTFLLQENTGEKSTTTEPQSTDQSRVNRIAREFVNYMCITELYYYFESGQKDDPKIPTRNSLDFLSQYPFSPVNHQSIASIYVPEPRAYLRWEQPRPAPPVVPPQIIIKQLCDIANLLIYEETETLICNLNVNTIQVAKNANSLPKIFLNNLQECCNFSQDHHDRNALIRQYFYNLLGPQNNQSYHRLFPVIERMMSDLIFSRSGKIFSDLGQIYVFGLPLNTIIDLELREFTTLISRIRRALQKLNREIGFI